MKTIRSTSQATVYRVSYVFFVKIQNAIFKTNLDFTSILSKQPKVGLDGDQLLHTPLLKKLNRARNDLSGKVIPLFKTYQDWEKKIIFEPFDRENLAGQPTILVRIKWPFFTPICQKAWQANYFIRKFWHGWSYFLHSPRLSFLIPLYSIIYRGIIVSNSRSLNWPSFNVIIKDDWP